MVTLDQGGLARRRIEMVATPPDLAAIVEHAWIQRDHATPGQAWRVVPDASSHLIVSVVALPDRESARATVVGPRTTFGDVDVSHRRLTLGIRLRPGALATVARQSATAFTDRVHPLRDVFGAAGKEVEARIAEDEPRLAMQVLFALLRGSVTGTPPDRLPFAAASRASSVAQLARALGVPVRTLHQRSREQIGFGPKRLLRVLRLHRALEAAREPTGWAAVAALAGFADQPHLIREWRSLLGETPTAWRARGTGGEAAADSFKTTRGRRR